MPTNAEIATLRVVLASGGRVVLTQGRLRRYRYAVRKLTAARLVAKGLAEWGPGTVIGAGPVEVHLFATAAGCRAVHAADAQLAEAQA